MFDLDRFVIAQDTGLDCYTTYEDALAEVKRGFKRSHWIWYVFPQMRGLGHSPMAERYGIQGREEAMAYIQHPVLRDRLVEITQAVLDSNASVYDIFGRDAIKVRSCILLFASVCDIPVFQKMKARYCW